MNARVSPFLSAAAMLAPLLLTPALNAQVDAAGYTETLLPGSTYTRYYCRGICACVDNGTTGPLSGSLTLRFSHQDQWTAYYDVTDVDLTGSTSREATIHYTGTGTYSIGGDFAYTHQLKLDLVALHEATPVLHHFDSGVLIVPPASQFPAISITLATPVMGCNQRYLNINTSAAAVPGCLADIGAAGGTPGHDGRLDNNDFIAFIAYFFDSDPRADRGMSGGLAGSDEQFDNNDFIAFINQFFADC